MYIPRRPGRKNFGDFLIFLHHQSCLSKTANFYFGAYLSLPPTQCGNLMVHVALWLGVEVATQVYPRFFTNPSYVFNLQRLWYMSLCHEIPRFICSGAKLGTIFGTTWWPAAFALTIACGGAGAPQPIAQVSFTHHGQCRPCLVLGSIQQEDKW